MMKYFGCITLLAVATFTAWGSDWPQFRGADGQGHADASNLPIQWSKTQNIVWEQPIPGAGWSSPIILQQRVYLTTAVQAMGGGNQSLRVICLDTHTGKILWNTEAFSVAASGAHTKNSHASPTPVTDGSRIYAHFGHYGTAALDLKGQVVWRNTSLKYPSAH